jgi:RHH-type rel operon transcriptional repressor/antitoxin RelB
MSPTLSVQTVSLRIPPSVSERLNDLVKKTGRSKTYFIREALLEHLDELEDIYAAEAIMAQVKSGEEVISSLDDVERRLGLGN